MNMTYTDPISECKTCFFDTIRNIFKRKAVVSLLRLNGVIGRARGSQGISFETYDLLIDKAFKVSDCKAVILVINSPGGSPAQCEMIADKIIRLSKEKKIPVYSFAEDIAASAGYWLLATGNEIYANRGSLVGSLGVLYAGFGFTEAIKKLGIERRTHYEGKHKLMLDPFQEEKEEDIAALKRMQKDLHSHFKEYVLARRHGKLMEDMDDIFSGMFWTGSMALELGLVDGINNYSRFIAERFGKNTKVVQIKRSQPWWTKGITMNLNYEEIMSKLRETFNFGRFNN